MVEERDEKGGRTEGAKLRAEVGAIAEAAAVRLLPDERDHARMEILCELPEPRSVEIAAAEIPRPGCHPVGGVRDAEAKSQEVELLGRLVEARCEACVVQKPPEVVARIGEMRVRRGGKASRIDAAEDAAQVGGEDVGDARYEFGHAAYSVADARPTLPCTSTSSAAAEPGDRVAERHSAGARSSSCTGSSCGLPVRPIATTAAVLEKLSQALPAQLPGLGRLVGANDADLVGAWSAVQAGVAFGLRQRPESHGQPL